MRRSFLGIVWSGVVMFALMGPQARAAYPDHIITGIVPFDVGGPSDVLSRVVATALAAQLGQTIVIENKAGAAGNLGAGLVAHARPDGYTLLFSSVATTENPAVYRHMPYDPLKGLIPIAQFGESPVVIAVNGAKYPAIDLRDFIDLLRKNPGKLNLAAGGGGQSLTIHRFLLQDGVDAELLAYNSAGDASVALQSGEADFMLGDGASLKGPASGGRIRVLAVAGAERSPAFPDRPTTAEAGLPGYTDTYHLGFYTAAGTPADVVARLHDAAEQVLLQPDVANRFHSLGWSIVRTTQAEFAAYYLSEIAKWKDVAARAKLPAVD